MNLFAIVAVVAISTLIVAEVLVAYQKYQMKRQFLRNLDQNEPSDN